MIQLDDCIWGVLVVLFFKGFVMDEGKDEKEVCWELVNFYLMINNVVLVDQLDDLIFNIYVCCGNYYFIWVVLGGYDDVVDLLFI